MSAGLRLGSGLCTVMLLGWACGPDPVDPMQSDGSDTGSVATEGSGSVDTTGSVDVTTSTDDGPPPAYEEDDGGTGCTFTCPDPPPPPPPPTSGGGGFFECDLYAQDCPEGEKCMPWANDGGDQWNATRCSPIADNPRQPGVTCTVEGSGFSGIDNCDLGVVCWGVDPETNIGTCVSLCSTFDGELLCDDPDDSCIAVDGVALLCVEACDPVTPACAEGQGCYLSGSGFVCQAPQPEAVGEGQPCDGPLSCAGGLMCAYGADFSCGNEAGQGCCASVCDANVPDSCVQPTDTCLPWFPAPAPPEWTHVGVCAPA